MISLKSEHRRNSIDMVKKIGKILVIVLAIAIAVSIVAAADQYFNLSDKGTFTIINWTKTMKNQCIIQVCLYARFKAGKT